MKKNKKCIASLPKFTKEDGERLKRRADFLLELVMALETGAAPLISVSEGSLNKIIEVAARWDFKQIRSLK